MEQLNMATQDSTSQSELSVSRSTGVPRTKSPTFAPSESLVETKLYIPDNKQEVEEYEVDDWEVASDRCYFTPPDASEKEIALALGGDVLPDEETEEHARKWSQIKAEPTKWQAPAGLDGDYFRNRVDPAAGSRSHPTVVSPRSNQQNIAHIVVNRPETHQGQTMDAFQANSVEDIGTKALVAENLEAFDRYCVNDNATSQPQTVTYVNLWTVVHSKETRSSLPETSHRHRPADSQQDLEGNQVQSIPPKVLVEEPSVDKTSQSFDVAEPAETTSEEPAKTQTEEPPVDVPVKTSQSFDVAEPAETTSEEPAKTQTEEPPVDVPVKTSQSFDVAEPAETTSEQPPKTNADEIAVEQSQNVETEQVLERISDISNGSSPVQSPAGLAEPSRRVHPVQSPAGLAEPSRRVHPVQSPAGLAEPSRRVHPVQSPAGLAEPSRRVHPVQSPAGLAEPSRRVHPVQSPAGLAKPSRRVHPVQSPAALAEPSRRVHPVQSPAGLAKPSRRVHPVQSPAGLAKPSRRVHPVQSPAGLAEPSRRVHPVQSPAGLAKPSRRVHPVQSPPGLAEPSRRVHPVQSPAGLLHDISMNAPSLAGMFHTYRPDSHKSWKRVVQRNRSARSRSVDEATSKCDSIARSKSTLEISECAASLKSIFSISLDSHKVKLRYEHHSENRKGTQITETI